MKQRIMVRSRWGKLLFLLAIAWSMMVTTHESGHIICGWMCGGTLRNFELRPWRLPYSFFQPNPAPLITLWGGPLLGTLLPILIALAVRQPWCWFVAHFCTLANGTYIAIGLVEGDRFLDTAQLLEHGASIPAIGLYCTISIGLGYVGFRKQCIRVLSHEPLPHQDEISSS